MPAEILKKAGLVALILAGLIGAAGLIWISNRVWDETILEQAEKQVVYDNSMDRSYPDVSYAGK